MKIIAGFFASIAALFVLTLMLGTWYTVDEGERAVLTRNGAVTGVADPGLGFKWPIIDKAHDFSVRVEKVELDKVASYTRDQQQGTLRISVNYQLAADQVRESYTVYGSVQGVVDRLITPRVYSELKNVMGGYTAIDAVQKREKLSTDVREAIQRAVKGPVLIHGVQIENIDFSDAYEASNEQKQLAEVAVLTKRQELEKEKVDAQIKVTRAQGTADSTLAQAKADAEAVRIRGDADAAAIAAKTQALKEQGAAIVNLTAVEKWDGKLPVTMVPDGATPFVSVK